jgi:hypothetical protein
MPSEFPGEFRAEKWHIIDVNVVNVARIGLEKIAGIFREGRESIQQHPRSILGLTDDAKVR